MLMHIASSKEYQMNKKNYSFDFNFWYKILYDYSSLSLMKDIFGNL